MRSVFPALTLTGLLGMAVCAGPSWQSTHSKDGAFQALFPGKAAHFARPVSTEPGAPFVHVYHYRDRGVPYVVASVHVPHDSMLNVDDRHLLDVIVEYAEKSGKVKVLSKRPYAFQGANGRELKVQFPNGCIDQVRMVILGDYFYEWLAQTNPGGKPNPNAARFLASFQPDPSVIRAARAQREEQHEVARLLAATQGAASDGWRSLDAQRGGFSVEMPEFVRYAKSKVNDRDAPGRSTTMYRVTAPASSTRREIYIIAYTDDSSLLTAQTADQWLDEYRNAASSHRGMRLTSSQDIVVNGNPGREYRYDDGAGFSEMTRVVLAGTRLYVLTAIAPVEHSYSDQTMRFLRSFKLTGAAKAPIKSTRPPVERRDTL